MKFPNQLNTFYKVSLGIFLLLLLVRWVFNPAIPVSHPAPTPVMAEVSFADDVETQSGEAAPLVQVQASTAEAEKPVVDEPVAVVEEPVSVPEETADKPMASTPTAGKPSPHPIRGVHSYADCFPDLQDVQIVAARKNGVPPPRDRAEAERRKDELVYVGGSPYYHLDPTMSSSIPYLVPKASRLLNRIGRNFFDSLYVKGIPLHKIIVSSVLRSEEDVEKLARINGNVSPESCHRYGTTIDICHTRFHTVSPPGGPARRLVRDDTLKYVLSEVLRDLRAEGACYVKYEFRQSCFHITVR